jgi:hypothetical protein
MFTMSACLYRPGEVARELFLGIPVRLSVRTVGVRNELERT